jgi:hypothetical protein
MTNNGKQPATDDQNKIDFSALVASWNRRQPMEAQVAAQQKAFYEGSKPPLWSDELARNTMSDEEYAERKERANRLRIAEAALDARRSGSTRSGLFPQSGSEYTSTPSATEREAEASIGGGPAVSTTAPTSGLVGFEQTTHRPPQAEIDRVNSVNSGAPSAGSGNESGDGENP